MVTTAEPRLVDAVTLRHFGAVHRMDVLEARLQGYSHPRWTEAIQDEILRYIDEDDCATVLASGFLGTPYHIPDEAFAEVFRLQIALGGGTDALQNLGEAEAYWVADHKNGTLITDDYAAFDLAVKNLGSNRVMDTIDILREAVRAEDLDPSEAQHIADAIRNSGRHLRAGHPPTLTADYFDWPGR